MKAIILTPVEVELKTIKVSADVRYHEDAKVNGLQDNDGKLMPFLNGNLWQPEIDIDSGIVKDWPIGTTANLHYKVCDCFSCKIFDDEGNEILELCDVYVPRTMSPKENGFGDYIIMDINENGKIQKWDFQFYEFVDKANAEM